MKRLLSLIALFLSPLFIYTAVYAAQPLIPQPAQYTPAEGIFIVPDCWNVKTTLPKKTTEKLLNVLKHNYVITDTKSAARIDLYLKEDKGIASEDYQLEITPSAVTLTAGTEKGFYYGLQSLYQISYLLSNNGNSNRIEIPCATITDSPRFAYRALMLDAARYFIPKEEVLKLVDLASALKFNTLHMHLTDDNGWRMEIKQYPLLTEVGAWRVDRPEVFPGRENARSADEPTPVGGFYTQDDLREIVAYAADRYVNVVPEIEMPAHAAAAIASYPELACPVVDKFVGVFPGIGGEDASIIMCGGNDKVYEFYKNVLDEVMDVFPSEYIHLGGDEADKRVWKECPLCTERIELLGLDGYEGLQGYFMDQINSYVRTKGRKAIGWDEVTYGNPKEDMIIIGWQGSGNVAVKDSKSSGRKFILSPSKILYLLRYQGPQWFEPYTYFGNNTLKDVYEFEPVKDDWTPELKENLLGIQGSIWTEFCNSPEDVEYLLFPRLIAVADAAWRPEGSENWAGFLEALDSYLPELQERGIIHANSMYNIQHAAAPTGEGVTVNLESIRPDVDIIYTVSGNEGNPVTYSGPLSLDSSSSIVAATYKDGKQMGRPLALNVAFNNATGKNVTSANCNNELQGVLTNGVRGSQRISDFEWAGWHNRDAEFVVDLGEIIPFNNCTLGTIGAAQICVAMPENAELYGSVDGQNYEFLSRVTTPEELVFVKLPTLHEIDFGPLDANARYLKVVAKNPGKIPAGEARGGAATWLYFDELTLR
ncbi:MAG: family 20 glycosylhydrolase [Muribaculaceae bacterium]|nr:family 20 glycosylhydrolase [Muribaculaceae bacterium]